MFLRAAEKLELPPGRASSSRIHRRESPPDGGGGMSTLGVRRVPGIDLSAAARVVDEVAAEAILGLANQ